MMMYSSYALYPIIEYNCKRTMQISPKHTLPAIINKIHAKRSALFLQKLILFDPEPTTEGSVRHYDYDCEAIHILVSFFKKKQQNILLKSFNAIRLSPFLPPRRLSNTERKPWNGTTRRSNNTTFTNSEGTPIKYGGLSTIRSRENDKSHLQRSGVREVPVNKLHELLSKVKAVNLSSASEKERIRTDHGPNRDNATYCLGNSRDIFYPGNLSCRAGNELNATRYYQSQQSSRQSRRQFILQKFDRIESNVNQLQEQGLSRTGVRDIQDELSFLRQKLTTRAIRRSALA